MKKTKERKNQVKETHEERETGLLLYVRKKSKPMSPAIQNAS
jgi:hypothetical protein